MLIKIYSVLFMQFFNLIDIFVSFIFFQLKNYEKRKANGLAYVRHMGG